MFQEKNILEKMGYAPIEATEPTDSLHFVILRVTKWTLSDHS